MPVELSEEEQKVFAYVKKHCSIKRAEVQKLLEVSDRRARYVFERMVKEKLRAKRDNKKAHVTYCSNMDNLWTTYDYPKIVLSLFRSQSACILCFPFQSLQRIPPESAPLCSPKRP